MKTTETTKYTLREENKILWEKMKREKKNTARESLNK